MKTFAAALLCISAYGATTETTSQVATGATAEIQSAVASVGYGLGGIGLKRRGLVCLSSDCYSSSSDSVDVSIDISIDNSYSYDSYSSNYSLSDYFSSDYSDHDYGYGYRRRYGNRVRYFRYRPHYYNNHYYYGRRYASRLGVYHGVYASYGYRSYGYGYRGHHGGYRRSYGHHNRHHGSHHGLY